MPRIIEGAQGSKKRKNQAKDSAQPKRRAVASDGDDEMAQIVELENQISESRKYYNNIATLISMLNVFESVTSPNLAVAVSLCRVFCRLIAGGNLTEASKASEQDKIVVAWLKERSQEYQNALLSILREGDASAQATSLTLCMRLVKERVTHAPNNEAQVWTSGFFKPVVGALLEAQDGDAVREEFAAKYLKAYDDVRYYTFVQISDYASAPKDDEYVQNIVSMLSELDNVPKLDDTLESFYIEPTKKTKNPVLSVTSHKKRAQEAWLAVLHSDLEESQRKKLLRIMAYTIAPWFLRPELLMDFLTDSYDVGGAMSLLALSGLFYLIQERNLDYPQFYPKLYSLLDADLLHSKHRSRFFRLMNTFLASTHLPAALVASFIKRLSRLALNAPPSAIVAIVPWIYNLMKDHPSCTFMMHRVIRGEEEKAGVERQGMDDPFDLQELDPILTKAIESSLWEIETLQSHYHPNVAALARIISEQFTKQSYNLEDFLDYSYQGMLNAELGSEEKPLRKLPVVEFQIPKRIFTDRLLQEDGGVDVVEGSLMRSLWDFTE